MDFINRFCDWVVECIIDDYKISAICNVNFSVICYVIT